MTVVRHPARQGRGSVPLCFRLARTGVYPRLSGHNAPALLDHRYVSLLCPITPNLLISLSGLLWSLLEDWGYGLFAPGQEIEDRDCLLQLCPAEGQLQAPHRLGT
jgi:hypothetical protein